MDSIICIVLGMLFANGVPHFVKGITAEKWDVPWKKPASASTNVLWGIANWLVVVILYALFILQFPPFVSLSASDKPVDKKPRSIA